MDADRFDALEAGEDPRDYGVQPFEASYLASLASLVEQGINPFATKEA